MTATRPIHIAPSILAADFRKLETEIRAVEAAGAHRIHCDVMDGNFVPNISFGPMVVEAAKKCTRLPLDVHLMILNPDKYLDAFAKAGADILIVHAEVCGDKLPDILKSIRDRGMKSGVCVNPDKPVDLFLPWLNLIDQVLIMSVYAGFGGQKFLDDSLKKISVVAEAAKKISHPIDIEVDGGINEETAFKVVHAGANVLVAGTSIFGNPDYKACIDKLMNASVRALTDR